MKGIVLALLIANIIDASWLPCDEPGISLLEVQTDTGHFYRFRYKTKDVTGHENEIVEQVEKFIQNKEP